MYKKFLLLVLLLSIGSFVFLQSNADAATKVLHKNDTISHGYSPSHVFYTSDGKVTVEVNILSFKNNEKNNTLQVLLMKPMLFGGYFISDSKKYSTTGVKPYTYDFGEAGYYRIELGLGGSTGFSTPVKIYTETKIYD